MSVAIDIDGGDWALVVEAVTNDTLVGQTLSVEHWLYRMWGIRPGTSSPIGTSRTLYPYPPAVAEWLHTMWGIHVVEPLKDGDGR